MADRFVLFSLPRCGSTTLMRILAGHPRIDCLREPFNPDQSGRVHLDRVPDPPALDTLLGELFAHYQGIKHVWHPGGWPFPDPEYNLRLLGQPGVTVLFLRRRNELRRLLSHEIARQTRVWHRPLPDKEIALAALDPAALRAELNAAGAGVTACVARLAAGGTRWKALWYEDFFDPAVPAADRLPLVDELIRYLGYPALTGPAARDRALGLLRPGGNRLNDETSYRRIPNIDQIDAVCGNSRTGRVFAGDR